MPKLKISNFRIDNLLRSAGKSNTVTQYGIGKSKIEKASVGTITITSLNSEIREDASGIYEVAKIKVESIDKQNVREAIQSAIPSGQVLQNHYVTIPSLLDLDENRALNITKANPSFTLDCKFNYVATDYDNLQISIDEINLNSILDPTTKNEIINYQKIKKARVANFARGEAMKNFVIPQVNSPNQLQMPYYLETTLNDGVSSGIATFLQKIQVFDEVLNDYLFSKKAPVEMNIQSGTSTVKTRVPTYNLSKFFDSNRELDTDNFYGLTSSGVVSKMSFDLRKHLFKGFLKKSTTIGFRTYQQVLENSECHKEAFAYSLEKFDGANVEQARIQNLFAPAGSGTTRFVDTQIKYGKDYFIKADAHYMIVGNSYKYEDLKFFKEDEGSEYAIVTVINRPNVVIAPVQLFSKNKMIIQPPPVHPQVDFKVESNASDEVQIYLSPTKSEVRANFIEILPTDAAQTDALNSFYSNSQNGFTFKTTNESGLYEVFRTQTPPTSYSSFRNYKLSEIRMPFITADAVFRDSLTPNEDYYYIFRKMNEKGLVSNPTSVFKVSIVVDADDSRVNVETYSFPPTALSQPRAEFKSMMQIRPSIEQTLFNDNQDVLYEKRSLAGTLDDLKLGIVEESVWGRKIKLRVRSKTSGKIIDLNINFNLSKNKTKEEF
jgi:hypothetical protein